MATYVDVELSGPVERRRMSAGQLRVSDTSMYSFIPRDVLDALGIRGEREVEFQRRDGTLFVRLAAAAIVHVAGQSTVDDVILCEADDEPVLGWRALSGLNLRVDERTGLLVDRGPVPAATSAVLSG